MFTRLNIFVFFSTNKTKKNTEFRTLVTLIVNDLNDETPRFTQSAYEFVVDTNQLSSVGDNKTLEVGSVFAFDLDKADLGNLKFDLELKKASPSSSSSSASDLAKFNLSKRGFGESAILMPVQFIVDASIYELKVRVTDLNGHSSEADVRVRVESKSLFTQLRWSQEEAYSSSIKENSPPGTQLIGVIIDVDGLPLSSPQRPQLQLGYTLAQPNQYFEIEEKTGVREKIYPIHSNTLFFYLYNKSLNT